MLTAYSQQRLCAVDERLLEALSKSDRDGDENISRNGIKRVNLLYLQVINDIYDYIIILQKMKMHIIIMVDNHKLLVLHGQEMMNI